MNSYYDTMVTHVLPKPLALCGFYGAEISRIAYQISCFTGIPVVDVERRLEHDMGCSLLTLFTRGTYDSVYPLEEHLLFKATSESLPPIIALRPDSMQNPHNLVQIQRSCTLVYIKYGAEYLFQQLQDAPDNPSNRLALSQLPFETAAALDKSLLTHESVFMTADKVFHLTNEHPKIVAHQLLNWLEKEILVGVDG